MHMEHCCLAAMYCSPHHCEPCWQLGVPRLPASRRRVQKGPPAILGLGTGVFFHQRAAACICLCTEGSIPLTPVRHRPSLPYSQKKTAFIFDGLASNWVYLIVAEFKFDVLQLKELRRHRVNNGRVRCHSVWL